MFERKEMIVVTLLLSLSCCYIVPLTEAAPEKLASISVKNILGRNSNNNNNTSNIEENNINDIESSVNNSNSSSNSNNRKTFVSVTAECHASGNVSFILHLHTSEPFQGWFYARDHQMTCSQRGSGQTVTTLLIRPDMDCGMKKVDKKKGEAKNDRQVRQQSKVLETFEEVALYVQHDEYVQQVIDEQFVVDCKAGQRHGIVSYQHDSPMTKTMDQIVTKTISTQPVKEELVVTGKKNPSHVTKSNDDESVTKFQPRFGIALSDAAATIQVQSDEEESGDVVLVETENTRDVIENDTDDVIEGGNNNVLKIGRDGEESAGWKPVAVIRHHDMLDFHTQPVSGWMELTSASTSEVIEDRPVVVGKQVNLVIRLRQSRDRDTMVSSCAVHGERGAEEEERQRRREERGFYPPQSYQSENPLSQDLTDYRGCSIDTSVMPNFAAAFNSMTGVKKLSTTFPVFKFPARSKLTFRCSVLVCRKNCPVAKCDKNADLATSPQQEFQSIKIMEKFLVETSVEVVEKGDYIIFDDEPASRPDQDTDRSGSNLLHSALQLEVGSKLLESSGSVRKASQPEQLELPPDEKNDDNSAVLLEEDQLCLSPSRLVLGFGILLVILLLALVASCMMWMRARSYSRRPKPVLSPRPPPRVQMSPGGVPTRVATPMGTATTTTGGTIVSTRPYFVAPRYIRVMH